MKRDFTVEVLLFLKSGPTHTMRVPISIHTDYGPASEKLFYKIKSAIVDMIYAQKENGFFDFADTYILQEQILGFKFKYALTDKIETALLCKEPIDWCIVVNPDTTFEVWGK